MHLTDYDKRMIEWNEKDKKGITTVGNLYCEDQLIYSERGKENFEGIKWAPKDGCQKADCPRFMTDECYEVKSVDKCPLK